MPGSYAYIHMCWNQKMKITCGSLGVKSNITSWGEMKRNRVKWKSRHVFQQFDSLSYETIMHAMRNLLIRIFYSNIDVTKYKINISVSRFNYEPLVESRFRMMSFLVAWLNHSKWAISISYSCIHYLWQAKEFRTSIC